MLRRSKIQFVHCILPKADALKALSGSLFKGVECEAQGESGDPSLMQLDVASLRAQIRGSKLLDALRIYRQGEVKQTYPLVHVYLKKKKKPVRLNLIQYRFSQVTLITWCSLSSDGALMCWHRISPRSTEEII